MSQKTRIGQLWGIVLAGGDGTRVRPFLSQLCGGCGIKQFCSIIVTRFWEKPSLAQAHTLWRRGALWNSFVCVTQSETLWRMVQQAAPDIYLDFLQIFRALETSQAERVIRQVYRRLRAVNFSEEFL